MAITNMIIPEFFKIQSRVFLDIYECTEKNQNDADLGSFVRKIINDYKEGKYNTPSDIEFDEISNKTK